MMNLGLNIEGLGIRTQHEQTRKREHHERRLEQGFVPTPELGASGLSRKK
jgi:hypothetical protein